MKPKNYLKISEAYPSMFWGGIRGIPYNHFCRDNEWLVIIFPKEPISMIPIITFVEALGPEEAIQLAVSEYIYEQTEIFEEEDE